MSRRAPRISSTILTQLPDRGHVPFHVKALHHGAQRLCQCTGRRLRGLLKPGGCLIAEVPNVRYHPLVCNVLAGHWSSPPAGPRSQDPVRWFTRREIDKLLQRAGLVLDRTEPIPGLGYDEWQARGRPGEVQAGQLHTAGLAAAEAEEFYVLGYRVRATPVPAAAYGLTSIVIERLFDEGAPWFRQSALYALFHILLHAPSVDEEIFRRYGAMTERFFADGGATMHTSVGDYSFPPHLAWPEIVSEKHRPNGEPWLLPRLLQEALVTGEPEIVPRISDVYAAIPSMTGKMELEYEGEQIGANRIAKDLIKRAAGEVFEGYFVGIDFAPAVQWFDQGNNLRMADTASACVAPISTIATPSSVSSAGSCGTNAR